ncbi:unnamed protein product [Prunus armeniaca]
MKHPKDVSKQDTDINKQCVLDYKNEFITNKIFVSHDVLIRWTREQGKRNGFVIIIKMSDIGGADSKTIHKLDQSSNPPNLPGVNCGPGDAWQLEVVCGVYNHPAALNMEGHSYAGRLTVEENLLVVDMSKSLARPKDILYTLKCRYGLNVTTMKRIYNARQKSRVIEKAMLRNKTTIDGHWLD